MADGQTDLFAKPKTPLAKAAAQGSPSRGTTLPLEEAMLSWIRIGLFASAAGLGVLLAIVSLRYLLPTPPHVPPEILVNWTAHRFAFAIHATAASTALVLAPFQFLRKASSPRPRWHRVTGRFYVGCVLAAAICGMALSFSALYRPAATVGFGSLAIVWFSVTVAGWRQAVRGRMESHRRWMVRSVALTLSAVTLRLMLPFAGAAHLSYADWYRVVSFLCWTTNLVLAELIFVRRWRAAPASAKATPRMAHGSVGPLQPEGPIP